MLWHNECYGRVAARCMPCRDVAKSTTFASPLSLAVALRKGWCTHCQFVPGEANQSTTFKLPCSYLRLMQIASLFCTHDVFAQALRAQAPFPQAG